MRLFTPLTKTYRNPSANTYRSERSESNAPTFHYSLSSYAATSLHHLPDIVPEAPGVFLKDESNRFGLLAFKIQKEGLGLVTASTGNWGRAVARTATLYAIGAAIYVPSDISASTRELIESESAPDSGILVRCVPLPPETGTYDNALEVVRGLVVEDPEHLLLTMDTSWEGYESFPHAVTAGYVTMLSEVLEQLKDAAQQDGRGPTHIIISVGVGSWAHAIVMYYSSLPAGIRRPVIITVEPQSATCLLTSLHLGKNTQVRTSDTVLAGMNCGKVSDIAWPMLKEGIDVAVAISDLEAHAGVLELQERGLDVGPCGAATLAGLRKALSEEAA